MMTFNEYQTEARKTAIYPGQGTIAGLNYCVLKLAGEAGEVAEKLGKIYRDKGGIVDGEEKGKLTKEVGDVLWYCSMIAEELGVPFAYIAQANLFKLKDRKDRGVLGGSGDNR
jgi:NTP pyrophosphatase (non-canonical NTP hydrolase)